MDAKQRVLKWLKERGILFELYEHERVFSLEECLRLPFVDDSLMFCKNILLCDRQKRRFFFVLLKPNTPLRTAVVSRSFGVSRLSFAPEEILQERLHLTSGSLSPLGLIFDEEHSIPVGYEPAIRNTKRIAFHPCDNSATLIFEQGVFWKQVIPELRVSIQPIQTEVPWNEPDSSPRGGHHALL